MIDFESELIERWIAWACISRSKRPPSPRDFIAVSSKVQGLTTEARQSKGRLWKPRREGPKKRPGTNEKRTTAGKDTEIQGLGLDLQGLGIKPLYSVERNEPAQGELQRTDKRLAHADMQLQSKMHTEQSNPQQPHTKQLTGAVWKHTEKVSDLWGVFSVFPSLVADPSVCPTSSGHCQTRGPARPQRTPVRGS